MLYYPGLKLPQAQPQDDKLCAVCNFNLGFGKKFRGIAAAAEITANAAQTGYQFSQAARHDSLSAYPLSHWPQGKHFDGITRHLSD